MKFLAVLFCLLAPAVSFSPQVAQVYLSVASGVGDGTTDDTAALQADINALPSGGTLEFGKPDKRYKISSTLTLLPNRRYQGQNSALVMAAGTTGAPPIAKCLYGACDGITITGLVFDGNTVASGLQTNVEGGTATPAKNVTVSYNMFRNTVAAPANDAQGALYAGSGLISSVISSNQFVNVGRGLAVINPQNLTISDNSFEVVLAGNAISLLNYVAPYSYGQNVQVIRNNGHHLGRMAIEVFAGEALPGPLSGVTISDNEFTDWDNPSADFPFGISVVTGVGSTITNNKLIGGVGVGSWGIEMASPSSTVTGNAITGFDSGIVLNNSFGSKVAGNIVTAPTSYGIVIGNATGSKLNLTIDKNLIINAKLSGIYVNSPDWGGSTISSNRITRAAGFWAGDNSATFVGVSVFPPGAAVSVTGNVVTQSALAGPTGFTFTGIAVNGGSGANTGSTYSNNTIASLQTLANSVGFSGNSSGSMNGTILKSNNISGLFGASGGVGSTGVVAVGNVLFNCNQVGPTPVNH